MGRKWWLNYITSQVWDGLSPQTFSQNALQTDLRCLSWMDGLFECLVWHYVMEQVCVCEYSCSCLFPSRSSMRNCVSFPDLDPTARHRRLSVSVCLCVTVAWGISHAGEPKGNTYRMQTLNDIIGRAVVGKGHRFRCFPWIYISLKSPL